MAKTIFLGKSKNQTTLVFFGPFLLGVIALVGFDAIQADSLATEGRNLILLSWAGVFLFIWSFATWYQKRKELICPNMIFLFCAYIFMYGQSFLWAFGLEGVPDLRDIFPAYQIVIAQVFTLLGLGFFHIGMLFSANRISKPIDSAKRNDSNLRTLYKSIQIIGWGLLAVSVIPFITIMRNQVILTHLYGYGFLFDSSLVKTGFSAVGIRIADFFVLSLFCLFIGYRENRPAMFLILTIILIRIAAAFYVGGRSPGMVLVICIICMWHFFISRINLKKGLLLIFLSYILISILPTISSVRHEIGRTFQDYVSAITINFGKGGQFINAISEMGFSMFPLIETMNLVPSQYSFRYGRSYFYSLFSLVPNLGFWQVHPAFQNANLGDWLQSTLGLKYGPGYSHAAEAYINFGWGGILAMFALGIFFGKVFTLINRNNATLKPDKSVFVFVLLSLTVMITRNSFISTARAVFYYSGAIYVATILLNRYLNQRRRNKLSKHMYYIEPGCGKKSSR